MVATAPDPGSSMNVPSVTCYKLLFHEKFENKCEARYIKPHHDVLDTHG
jgi:hypothetical protein